MDQSIFDAGYGAGVNAHEPLSAYSLSSYMDDYKVGYVVGLAFMESVRRASPYAGAIEAAVLGQQYSIPYEALAPYFDDSDDPDVLDYLRRGYAMGDDGEEDES